MTKSADARTKAMSLYQSGLTDAQVAELVGVAQGTVFRWRKAAGIPRNPSVSKAAHGTRTKYNAGCRCSDCRDANSAYQRGSSGYTNWGCRCDVCSSAHADEMRQSYRSRVARGLPPDDPRHGTASGYINWGCRCDACRISKAETDRTRRARRKTSGSAP